MSTTQLQVNGVARRVENGSARSLLSVLRDDLDLTGTKYGCGEGRCGACTVLIDGKAVRSCITVLEDVAGKEVRTVEGLEHEGRLHALQQAFIDAGAMQCGYCTSGMLMSGVAILEKEPSPSRENIVRAMLFVGETPLTDPVAGTSAFAAEFMKQGPRDKQGRSLRDLDLKRRLLRYPLSYLVYSKSFDGMPDSLKSYLSRRFHEVLSGQGTSPDFAHLSEADRKAILEILKDTKPDF